MPTSVYCGLDNMPMGFGSPIARLDVFGPQTSGEPLLRWTVISCAGAALPARTPAVLVSVSGIPSALKSIDCTIKVRHFHGLGRLRSNSERIGGDLAAYFPGLEVAFIRFKL